MHGSLEKRFLEAELNGDDDDLKDDHQNLDHVPEDHEVVVRLDDLEFVQGLKEVASFVLNVLAAFVLEDLVARNFLIFKVFTIVIVVIV